MKYKKNIYSIFIIFYLLLGIFSEQFAKLAIFKIGFWPILPTEILIFLWIPLFIKNLFDYPNIEIVLVYLFLIVINFLLTFTETIWVVRIVAPFYYILLSYITFDMVNYKLDIKKIENLTKIASISAFCYTIFLILAGIKTLSENISTSTSGVYYLYEGTYGIFFLQFFMSLNSYFRRKNYLDLILMIMVLIWILFFGLHRSAVLSILITTIIFFYNDLLKKLNIVILFTVIFFISIIIFNILFQQKSNLEGIVNRISSIINSSEDSNVSWRYNMWSNVIEVFINEPIFILFGVGFSFFDFEFSNQLAFSLLKAPFEGFHNSLLFILFRIGIIGFMLLFIFFYKGIKKVFDEKKYELRPFVAGLVAMIIFSFFNVVFENPYNGFYIWFNIGFIYGYLYKENKFKSPETINYAKKTKN